MTDPRRNPWTVRVALALYVGVQIAAVWSLIALVQAVAR